MRRDRKENQEGYLRALLKHNGISRLALNEIGLTRQALHRWEKSPVFRERVEAVIDRLESKYLSHLDALAKKGNVTAIIFALKSLRPEKYDDYLRRSRSEKADEERRPLSITLVSDGRPLRMRGRPEEEEERVAGDVTKVVSATKILQ